MTHTLTFFLTLDAQVTIKNADITKLKFTRGTRVQFQPFKQTQATVTSYVSGAMPVFDHSSVFYYEKVANMAFSWRLALLVVMQVTPELIEWLQNGFLTLMVFAKQEDGKPDAKLINLSTKELKQLQENSEPSESAVSKAAIR